MSHSYIRLSDLSPEDVEDGMVEAKIRGCGAIDDKDIIDYIRLHSSTTQGYTEFYFSILQDIFYNPNLRTNRLFVENPVTGQFHVVDSVQDINDHHNNIKQNKTQQSSSSGGANDPDKQLDAIHAVTQLAPEEELDLRSKMMSLPPKPIKKTRENANQDNNMDNADKGNNSAEDEWYSARMEYRNFAFVKRMIFFVFQGLLAGFCVVTVYFREALSESDTQFFTYYQPFAQEVRRYLYLLTSLALLGSLDHVFTSWNHILAPNPLLENNALSAHLALKLQDYQRLSLLLGMGMVLLYFLAFFASVIMAPFDILVYIRNNDGDDSNNPIDGPTGLPLNWAVVAENDGVFQDGFSQWQMLNLVRCATSLLAWLLCCYALWRDMSRYSKIWRFLRHTRNTAVLWMKQARLLQGQEDLDGLQTIELMELIRNQEFGLQRSRMALSLMKLEQQQMQQYAKNL